MKPATLALLNEQAQWDDPTEDGGAADTTEWLLPTGSLKQLVDERNALLVAVKSLLEGSTPVLWSAESEGFIPREEVIAIEALVLKAES